MDVWKNMLSTIPKNIEIFAEKPSLDTAHEMKNLNIGSLQPILFVKIP